MIVHPPVRLIRPLHQQLQTAIHPREAWRAKDIELTATHGSITAYVRYEPSSARAAGDQARPASSAAAPSTARAVDGSFVWLGMARRKLTPVGRGQDHADER